MISAIWEQGYICSHYLIQLSKEDGNSKRMVNKEFKRNLGWMEDAAYWQKICIFLGA